MKVLYRNRIECMYIEPEQVDIDDAIWIYLNRSPEWAEKYRFQQIVLMLMLAGF